MGTKDRTFIDKCIKDDKGAITVFQSPNLPLIVWGVSTIMARISSGTVQNFFGLIAFGAIFTWAWLELFQGVNYLRRLLGFVVIVLSIYSKLKY